MFELRNRGQDIQRVLKTALSGQAIGVFQLALDLLHAKLQTFRQIGAALAAKLLGGGRLTPPHLAHGCQSGFPHSLQNRRSTPFMAPQEQSTKALAVEGRPSVRSLSHAALVDREGGVRVSGGLAMTIGVLPDCSSSNCGDLQRILQFYGRNVCA